MKPVTFGQNASFTSIVSKCDGFDVEDEDTTIEARLRSMAGPQQPAMNPASSEATPSAAVVKVKRHPSDDPNWNGPEVRIPD